MGRKIYIDEKKLSTTLTTLSSICRGKIRFFDDATQYYVSAHRENLTFCSILSRAPKSNYLCTKCNEAENDRCRETKAVNCYFCHASLVEIMYPVLYDGVYVGHVSIGQFRSKQRAPEEGYFDYLSELSGVKPAKLRKAYYSQPQICTEEIEGAKLMLEMTAQRLCDDGVFYTDHHDAVNSIEEYIRSNLSGDLSLKVLAGQVYMNPTYLSAMYHKSTGVSLSDYIRRERITRAAYLLSTTTLSIAQVASAAGFHDPNYFAKVFREEFSCRPREYRTKIAQGEIVF